MSFPFTCVAVATACHSKWFQVIKTVSATLWTNCQIFTLIYSRPEREDEEHTERFLSVTDNDVDKLIEGEENTKMKRKMLEFRAKQTTVEGKP